MVTIHLLILILATCMIVKGNDCNCPREVTVDAAFRYDDDLILISGNQYMAVSPEGFERYIRERSGDTEVPSSEHIQAAVHWPGGVQMYYYGAIKSFRVNQASMKAVVKEYQAKNRGFLRDNGGPDAAAYKGGNFYIFQGCQYVSQKHTLSKLGEPKNVTDLDLPCDIDAAWTDLDTKGMTVLKGNNIWKWRDDEEVKGPMPFDEEYHIWSWQLKPYSENRFTL